MHLYMYTYSKPTTTVRHHDIYIASIIIVDVLPMSSSTTRSNASWYCAIIRRVLKMTLRQVLMSLLLLAALVIYALGLRFILRVMSSCMYAMYWRPYDCSCHGYVTDKCALGCGFALGWLDPCICRSKL